MVHFREVHLVRGVELDRREPVTGGSEANVGLGVGEAGDQIRQGMTRRVVTPDRRGQEVEERRRGGRLDGRQGTQDLELRIPAQRLP